MNINIWVQKTKMKVAKIIGRMHNEDEETKSEDYTKKEAKEEEEEEDRMNEERKDEKGE